MLGGAFAGYGPGDGLVPHLACPLTRSGEANAVRTSFRAGRGQAINYRCEFR